MPAKYNSGYGFNIPDDNLDANTEVWIDVVDGVKESTAKNKIFVGIEPEEVASLNSYVVQLKDEFTHVLTYDPTLLEILPNAHLFEYGTKWVPIEQYTYPTKKESLSMVCGHKQQTENHVMRQVIWYHQYMITFPKDFYMSQHGGVFQVNPSNKVLGESKFPLFDSMFHICIENVTKENFFTEKLIDCLLCKSVPVYVGCPNIGNYFLTEGFVQVDSAKQLIEACNNLSTDIYISKLPYIEENFHRALEWIDYNKRLKTKLNELLVK